MTVSADAWLGRVFGYDAFRVSEDGAEAGAVARSFADHAKAQERAFYFAKIDTLSTRTVEALCKQGFCVVDTNVVFEKEAAARIETEIAGVTVRAMTPEDRGAIVEVARDSFRFSRFHLDPRCTNELAGEVKARWCAAYFDGERGEHLFVAERDGAPMGFLAAAKSDGERKTATIELVAVSPKAQGKRVGVALVAAFDARYAGDGRVLRVGTQISNRPSIRLYERMGYAFTQSQFVLHAHVEKGQIAS